MLYLIHGGESAKRIEKIEVARGKLLTENSGALETVLNTEDITEEKLDELAFGQGLFQSVGLVIMRDTLETKELKELFYKKIKTITASPNIFIVGESFLAKDILGKVEKLGGVTEFLGAKKDKHEKDNSGFALADAIARRDRKGAWALFTEIMAKGGSSEGIHGIIFWQFKNLFLVKKGGLSGKLSFPLMKAKTNVPKWEEKELRTAMSRLVSIYHDSHRGLHEFPVALEKFLLDVV